jgi:hypothetical protein
MIAFAATTIIIRPSGSYCWIKISVEGFLKLESGHLLLTRPIVALWSLNFKSTYVIRHKRNLNSLQLL